MNSALFPNGCLVCGRQESHVLYKSTVPSGLTSDPAYYTPTYNKALLHGELSICDGCGFIFVSDRPTSDVIEGVYAGMEDDQYLNEARAYRMSFQHILDEIEKYKTQGKNLLEVGCGSGIFLDEARRRGWEAHGIELSNWMVREADKLMGPGVAVQGGYETGHPRRDKFDVIVAIHVVEHVVNPADFLERMADRLETGGILYLVTPDIGSGLARVLGEKWWYIQIPHIYYFDSRSMGRILSQKGFEVVKIGAYPRTLSRDIVANRIDFLPSWLRPLARIALFPVLLFPWRIRFHTGDQMTVIGRKK